jgi:hypothetical protein
MNAKRYNPCAPIRAALIAGGYSTVKVTNAVNSALGELNATSSESKLGDGRITKTAYKVTESTSTKFEGKADSAPLRFDAWCGVINKANDIASFASVEIPKVFKDWLEFAKVSEADMKKELATS